MNTRLAFHVVSKLALSSSKDITSYVTLAHLAKTLGLNREASALGNIAASLREADAAQLVFESLMEESE